MPLSNQILPECDAGECYRCMASLELGLWNSTLRAHARQGQPLEALQRFHQMQQEGVMADKDTCICILSVCANLSDLAYGKHVHAQISQGPMEDDTRVGNALVNLYGKCASAEDALSIFDLMPQHDLVSWSSMITVYAKHGYGNAALQLFEAMQEEGISPNRVTFISILSACASQLAIAEGKRVHARIEEGGSMGDVVLETALVNFYGKCGKLKDAQDVFDRMTCRDVVAWNAIIAASIHHKQGTLAFHLFYQMQMEGLRPDKVTFTSMVDACANHGLLVEGKQLHAYILEKGFEMDIVVGTALVDMHGRCGSLEDARRIFDKMPNPNVIAWNALIAVYAQHGLGKEAIQLFGLMQQKGLNADNVTFVSIVDACVNLAAPAEGRHMHACIVMKGFESDLAIGNALLNMYGKRNRLDDAQYVFDKMSRRDVVSWTSMIWIYGQEGYSKEAIRLFDKMHEKRVQPDKVTFISGLAACTSQMALAEGKQMHTYIIDSGIEIDIHMGNALVTMYAKCGNLETSLSVFDQMPNRDLISWNAIITAFAQHGLGKEAVQFYEKMKHKGFTASKVTFLGVLTACSHAGLVDDGCHCFISLNDHQGILLDVDHHDCMIDLLGRSGCLMEAEALVSEMPFQPTVLSFLVLLGACRHLADVELGERIAKYLYELEPHHPAPYVILSNIYVAAGREVDATKVLCKMRALDLREQQDQLIRKTLDFQMEALLFIEEEGLFAKLQS